MHQLKRWFWMIVFYFAPSKVCPHCFSRDVKSTVTRVQSMSEHPSFADVPYLALSYKCSECNGVWYNE